MRREPFGVGSYIHVVKRGARGLPVTRDTADQRRFARLLYYLNDEYQSEFWELDVQRLGTFERPKQWPARHPLVHVLAWTLMSNHFHLLLREIQDDGVSRFMQRVCGSMSRHYNEKYDERGSLFQGAYRSRTVNTDRYMRWALSYVMTKNVFELYPSGLSKAMKNFESAWKWAGEYPYSSFRDFATGHSGPIIAENDFSDFFSSSADFKRESHDMIMSKLEQLGTLEEITLE